MVKTETTKRIRGRPLARIRKRHLEKDPLCARCKAKGIYRLATQLDHIKALVNGGKEEESNRQGLCDECHKQKTIEDMNYKPKVKIGLDGFPIEMEN